MIDKDDIEGLTEVIKWQENERIWDMTYLNGPTFIIVFHCIVQILKTLNDFFFNHSFCFYNSEDP